MADRASTEHLEPASRDANSSINAVDKREEAEMEKRINSEFANVSLANISAEAKGPGGERSDEHLESAPAGANQLAPSATRLPPLGFLQDDDNDAGKFTLDDGDLSPQPSMTPRAGQSSTQAPAVVLAQDVDETGDRSQRDASQDVASSQEHTAATSVSRTALPGIPADLPYSAPLPMPPPGTEPDEFKGLLFYDGMDNVGRPVVVINARAEAMLQPKLRTKAMAYMTARLEPIVRQGPYVLILVASGHQGDTSSKLPALWLIKAYRSLSRPYKKNVKFIILVRPSAMLRAILVVLRPFLSLKAARKLHKVDSLLDIDTVTGGDVTAESTGPRFLREELGVEPGSLLPSAEAQQRAEQLDSEVQLGTF